MGEKRADAYSSDEVRAARRVIAAQDERVRNAQAAEFILTTYAQSPDGFGATGLEEVLTYLPRARGIIAHPAIEEAFRAILLGEITKVVLQRDTDIDAVELMYIMFGFHVAVPEDCPYDARYEIAANRLGEPGFPLSISRVKSAVFLAFQRLAWQFQEELDSTPEQEVHASQGEALEAIERSLSVIVRKGLPVMPQTASPELILYCLGVDITELAKHEMLPLVTRLNDFLCAQLDNFEVDELALPARILFAHAPGTKGLRIRAREIRIAEVIERSLYTVSNSRRQMIISAFAWQIYRAGLGY